MSDREQIDWASFDDINFVEEAATQIWLSSAAHAINVHRTHACEEAEAAYTESRRRGKPWLYCRAYNEVCTSCGYSLTALDREKATEAYWEAKKAEDAKAEDAA